MCTVYPLQKKSVSAKASTMLRGLKHFGLEVPTALHCVFMCFLCLASCHLRIFHQRDNGSF